MEHGAPRRKFWYSNFQMLSQGVNFDFLQHFARYKLVHGAGIKDEAEEDKRRGGEVKGGRGKHKAN